MKKLFFFIPFLVLSTLIKAQDTDHRISILVYPFTNSGDTAFEWISRGLTKTVISDLQRIKSINVFTDEDRKKVIDEIALGMTGLLADADVAKIGKVIGADLIFTGSYDVQGDKIRIHGRLIRVDTGKVDRTIKVDGQIIGIFDLQDNLVSMLMNEAKDISFPGYKKITYSKGDKDALKKLPNPPVKSYELYSKGLTAYEKNPAEAESYFTQAIAGDPDYYHAYLMLGSVNIVRGNLSESLQFLGKADSILKKYKMERSIEAAGLYTTIGNMYWNRGESDKCIEQYVRTKQILENLGMSESLFYSSILVGIGSAYRLKNDLDNGLEFTMKGKKLTEKLGMQKSSHYAWTLCNLAVIHGAENRYDASIGLYEEAIEIWESLGMKQSMGPAYATSETGWRYVQKGEAQKGLKIMLDGKKLCDKLNLSKSSNYATYMWYIAHCLYKNLNRSCEAVNYMALSVKIMKNQNRTDLPQAQQALATMKQSCGK